MRRIAASVRYAGDIARLAHGFGGLRYVPVVVGKFHPELVGDRARLHAALPGFDIECGGAASAAVAGYHAPTVEARQGSKERFTREEGGTPMLAEAPPVDRSETLELDAAELLSRLETQAAENGRLEARVDSLERAVRTERDARRRLASTLKRERKAAAALHERGEHHRAAHDAAIAELERVREAAAATELQLQEAWARLTEAQRPVATHELGSWRNMFRRSPPGA